MIHTHARVSRYVAEKLRRAGISFRSVDLERYAGVDTEPFGCKFAESLAKMCPSLEFVAEHGEVLCWWSETGQFVEHTPVGVNPIEKFLCNTRWFIARDKRCPEQKVFWDKGKWRRAVSGISNKANPSPTLSRQVGGNHYQNFEIQPLDFIHKNKLGFVAGNVIKYVCRAPFKNGIEDLKKAQHYLEVLIEDAEKKA